MYLPILTRLPYHKTLTLHLSSFYCDSAVTCPPLFAPVHGKMYGRDVGYGTVIRFECDEGYMNIGSTERRCQSDKTWSGKTAKCEGAKGEALL